MLYDRACTKNNRNLEIILRILLVLAILLILLILTVLLILLILIVLLVLLVLLIVILHFKLRFFADGHRTYRTAEHNSLDPHKDQEALDIKKASLLSMSRSMLFMQRLFQHIFGFRGIHDLVLRFPYGKHKNHTANRAKNPHKADVCR